MKYRSGLYQDREGDPCYVQAGETLLREWWDCGGDTWLRWQGDVPDKRFSGNRYPLVLPEEFLL